jgi:hypothetical protein
MIFRCTKITSCEEILFFPIKLMYFFSRSTKFHMYYLLYNLIFFSSIKVVQEYDYTIGVCFYGCTGVQAVRVYRFMGVQVYGCMGVRDTFLMH